MFWHHLSRNRQPIDRLYGDDAPPLRGCSLGEVRLHENGPTLTLVLHVAQMPQKEKWPRRWHAAANRVAIELTFTGLRQLDIQGWGVKNVVDVDIQPSPDGPFVAVVASGSCGHISATADFFNITRLQEYQVEE